MSQLYPPILEGKLPACGGTLISVPFVMNKSVNVAEVSGMSAMIKTTTTGRLIGTFDGALRVEPAAGKFYADFNDLEGKLKVGQFYKIQIAYKNLEGKTGYYSTVGVFKRTTFPILTIPALEESVYSGFEYTAVYSQENGDKTEKVYSYKFDLTDMNDNVLDTSGTQIHNSSKDTSQESSQDTWRPTITLEKNTPYYVTYQVTTMNNLTMKTKRYLVLGQESVDMGLNIELHSILDPDEGSVKINITTPSEEPIYLNGNFIISRSKNFSQWEDLYRFSYWNIKLKKGEVLDIWEDLTVEHGEEYIYAIQAYNSKGLYSDRLLAKNGILQIYFDDAFLYDGDYQLKIQFNPKVSSFKNVILESKQETIGSKYPFIFRNGNVHYKEFSISGLISLLSDPNEKFFTRNEWDMMRQLRQNTPSQQAEVKRISTDLTDENFYNERQFKLKVLEWLNDGKPKLFRSPAEGNYIVRLVNTSLSPNDTLGRMIHTFNCTAYEVMEPKYSNLVDLDIVHYLRDKTLDLRFGEFSPMNADNLKAEEKEIINYDKKTSTVTFNYDAYGVNITEADPYTVIQIKFTDNRIVNIEIGGTGSYYLQLKDRPVRSIQLLSQEWSGAKIRFQYFNESFFNAFNNIVNLDVGDEIRQFIGPGYQFNLPQTNWTDWNIESYTENYDKVLSDIRRELGSFHYIKVEKRYVQSFYVKDGKNYCIIDGKKTQAEILEKDYNPITIYHNEETNEFYSGKIDEDHKFSTPPDYRFCFNDYETVFSDFEGITVPEGAAYFKDTDGRLILNNPGKVETLRIGTGLIADLAYRVKIKEYDVEEFDDDVIEKKFIWRNHYEVVKGVVENGGSEIKDENGNVIDKQIYTYDEILLSIQTLNGYYLNYIKALEKALEERRAKDNDLR